MIIYLIEISLITVFSVDICIRGTLTTCLSALVAARLTAMSMIDALSGRIIKGTNILENDATSGAVILFWDVSPLQNKSEYFTMSVEATTGEFIVGMWTSARRWSGWRYESRRISWTFYNWGVEFWFYTKRHARHGYVAWRKCRARTVWTGPIAVQG